MRAVITVTALSLVNPPIVYNVILNLQITTFSSSVVSIGCWKVNLRQAVGQCRRAKKRASSESANKRKTADREKGRACEKNRFFVLKCQISKRQKFWSGRVSHMLDMFLRLCAREAK